MYPHYRFSSSCYETKNGWSYGISSKIDILRIFNSKNIDS